MNEYFTLYAEFAADSITLDSMCGNISIGWIMSMCVNHPTYAEPVTYNTILLRENVVDMRYDGTNMYLVSIAEYDDKYVRIYKNTY